MVGRELISQLLVNENYSLVKVFTRRSLEFKHEKLVETMVDFNQLSTWRSEIQGDVLFSSLGTTIKKAGSKELQYKIDYTYQFETARVAAENSVWSYVLVSSQGANSDSKIFYPQMKGQLDETIEKLPFKKATIMRPSILDGDRKESRPMEQFALKLMRRMAAWGLLKKYKPIHANVVAAAMINADLTGADAYSIVDHLEMFELAEG